MAVLHVQTQVGRNHAGGTSTAATITTTSGNHLVALVCLFDAGAGNPLCSGVARSGSGTTAFTPDITKQNATLDSRIYLFSQLGGDNPGGALTVTATHTLNALCVIYVLEASGVALSSPNDGTGANASATSASVATGNLAGVTATDDLWVGGFLTEAAITISANNWTIPSNGSTDSALSSDVQSAIQYNQAPGTTTGQMTATITSSAHAEIAWAYKAAAGAADVLFAQAMM